jgi:hypothetical protein
MAGLGSKAALAEPARWLKRLGHSIVDASHLKCSAGNGGMS